MEVVSRVPVAGNALFTETLRKTVDAEWAKIKQGAFWRQVMSKPVSPVLWRNFLVEVYHYSRHNSMNQAVAAFVPAPEGLLKFVYKHAGEELGHDLQSILDGLHGLLLAGRSGPRIGGALVA